MISGLYSHRINSIILPAILVAGCTAANQTEVESAKPLSDEKKFVPVSTHSGPVTPVYKEGWNKGEWLSKATERDKSRINDWQKSMAEGRASAVKAGHIVEIEAAGNLYSPDGANSGAGKLVKHVSPPAGMYNCSITKLGGEYLQYIKYPKFRCQITEEDGRRQFVKLTGSQRQIGYIYDSGTGRWDVFLGTIMLGDDEYAVPYGTDEKRDEPAIVQRIGEKRWRMVFPYPYYESTVDVMELTPVIE